MRFTLVGAGAIGSLWGLKLFEAGHQVHVVTRKDVSKVALGFEHQNLHTFPANRPVLIEESDCLLVCVKAFQIDDAIQLIKCHLHPDTPVVLMHNGMGAAAIALELLTHNPLLLATTSHGSLRLTESWIRHTGLGETRLGGSTQPASNAGLWRTCSTTPLPRATGKRISKQRFGINLPSIV
ncbi:ketopantoate reductase family protein [Grimontia hollisae]|uniref:ketopantoate reductase family protein n=1 Tax=Grimontia hollisae TaxID=673 RepID=UPI001E345509|nr:2-dehydropantoate 2-reductase N-terminal domain-containing protein [Grimontia hollisae]